VSMIDFANSYIGPYAEEQNAGARIQIEAACTLIDEKSGTSDTCYLIAPCRGENMYEESGLFKMPSYDWRAIFSENEHLIVRKGWTSGSNRNTLSSDSNNPLDVRTIADTQSLRSYAEIVERTLANVPIVARTEVQDTTRGLRAVLEYPVKTMNIVKEPLRFQVDTGPLILPDFESDADRAVERFDIAHVVYNVFDKAEFILRKPTQILEGDKPLYSVTDYSLVKEMPAQNEILCPA
jgi:hypothetical protein